MGCLGGGRGLGRSGLGAILQVATGLGCRHRTDWRVRADRMDWRSVEGMVWEAGMDQQSGHTSLHASVSTRVTKYMSGERLKSLATTCSPPDTPLKIGPCALMNPFFLLRVQRSMRRFF